MTYKSKYLQYKLKYILAKNFSGGGDNSHPISKTPDPKPSKLQKPSNISKTFESDLAYERPKTPKKQKEPKTPEKQKASETSKKQKQPKTPEPIRTDGPRPRQFRTPEEINKPIQLPPGLRTPGDRNPDSNIQSSYESLLPPAFELTTAEIPVQSTGISAQSNIELPESWNICQREGDIINDLEKRLKEKNISIRETIDFINILLKQENLTEAGKFRLSSIIGKLQRISPDFIPEEIVEAGDMSEDQEEVSESEEVTPVAQEVPKLKKESSDFIIYLYQEKGKRISKDENKDLRYQQNQNIIDFINKNKNYIQDPGTLELIKNTLDELIKEQKELSQQIEGESIMLNINLGDNEYPINVNSSQPLHETVLASLKDKKVDVKEPLLIMYGEEELLDEEPGVPNTFSDYGLEDNARLSVQFNVDDRSSMSSSLPSNWNDPPPNLNEEGKEVCKLGKCIIQGGNKKKYGVYQDKLVEIIKKHNDHPKPYYTINIKGGERQVDSLVELN